MTKIHPEKTIPTLKIVAFKRKKKKKFIFLRGHSLKNFESLDNRGIIMLTKTLAKMFCLY